MLTPSRQLTDAEKLRKVISELVDTERAYVKVMFNVLYIEKMLLWMASWDVWVVRLQLVVSFLERKKFTLN